MHTTSWTEGFTEALAGLVAAHHSDVPVRASDAKAVTQKLTKPVELLSDWATELSALVNELLVATQALATASRDEREDAHAEVATLSMDVLDKLADAGMCPPEPTAW